MLRRMLAIFFGKEIYAALATGVLLVHALFILWVATGALFTRSRPVLRWLHIASLVWAILAEVLACPLTGLENWLESQAGVQPYQGGFLLHYLDALVYPNIPSVVLIVAGIMVCVLNLAIHARRFCKTCKRPAAGSEQ
jgi:hypothetical protein